MGIWVKNLNYLTTYLGSVMIQSHFSEFKVEKAHKIYSQFFYQAFSLALTCEVLACLYRKMFGMDQ